MPPITDTILSRDLFYDRRRGRHQAGTNYRLLDFCLVDTPLGAMVEPRNMSLIGCTSGSNLTNLNADEIAFTRISEMDETTMFDKLGTAGNQLPIDYNTQ